MNTRSRHESRARRLSTERLEDRLLLSGTAWNHQPATLAVDATFDEPLSAGANLSSAGQAGQDDAPRFVPGEILVGFEGEVAKAYRSRGAAAAWKAADQLVGAVGLHDPKGLFDLPATAARAARVATRWLLPAGADVLETVARVARLPGVAYAEPNGIMTIQTHLSPDDPQDPSFTNPAGWPFGIQEHLPQIQTEEAWHVSTGGLVDTNGDAFTDGITRSQVVVAVVDTGVDLDHPDLDDNLLLVKDGAGNILGNFVSSALAPGSSGGAHGNAKGGIPGKPPKGGGGGGTPPPPQDDYGHGTHVAGIIAAEINNMADLAAEAAGNAAWNGGTVGVAPKARIMPVKVLDSGGGGTWDAVAQGIRFAADPTDADGNPTPEDDSADIINMSLGGGFSQTVSDAISFAYNKGVLVVSSAGNGNFEGSSHPGSDAYSLSVAAVDAFDVRAGFSNYGDTVDVAAPGVNVLSTFIDVDDAGESGGFTGAYGRISGTSMASPNAAGVAALIHSRHPDWVDATDPTAVVKRVAAQLLATANDIDGVNPDYAGKLGAGRVNAFGALGAEVTAPVVTAVGGIGSDGGVINRLEMGSIISVQYSHVMTAASVLDPGNYQLLFDANGDKTFNSSDPAEIIDLAMASASYDAFPGRGVRLRVAEAAPDGNYQFIVGGTLFAEDGITALDGDRDGVAGGNAVRTFAIQPPGMTTTAIQPFGAMIYQGRATDRLESMMPAFVPAGSGGLQSAGEMVFGPDATGDGVSELYVSSVGSAQVLRYDGATGAFIDVFVQSGDGGLSGPRGLDFGPDGNLYVAGSWSDGVYVYQGPGGAAPGQFVKQLDSDGTGQLGFPTGLVFGPDDQLYVSSNSTHQILRYDSGTDDFAEFVAAQAGGLVSPQGLTFGPDGNLYVASYSNSNVLRFDSGGNFMDEFVPGRSGGLDRAMGLAFANTDGTAGDELHVVSAYTDQVLRYNGSNGDFIDDYVHRNDGGLYYPVGVVAHGDVNADGRLDLYVGGWRSSNVIRFDGVTRGNAADADSDGFVVPLDANQTVTVKVSSSAEVAVTLTYEDLLGGPVTLDASAASGQEVLLQTVRTSAGDPLPAGTLTIAVQGPDALTAGPYDVEITLNSLVEQEDNNSTPQALDGSVVNLSPPGLPDVSRGAVLGTVSKGLEGVGRLYQEAEVGPNTHGFLSPNEDLRASWDNMGGTSWAINGSGNALSPLNKGIVGTIKKVDVFSPQYDGYDTYRFDATAGDLVTLRAWGKNGGGGDIRRVLVDLHNENGDQLIDGVGVPGVASDHQISNFAITQTGSYFIHVYADKKVHGSYTLTVDLTTSNPAGPPVPDSIDLYSFALAKPGRVSLTGPDQVTMSLFAPGVDPGTGVPVATSASDQGFALIETGVLSAGLYTVKVTAPSISTESIDYVMVLGIDGAFDHGPNATWDSPQIITGWQGVFGHVGGTIVGYYTDRNENTTAPEASILKAGSIPVHITDISTFNLNTIDVLMVNESSNGGLSTQLSDRLSDIQTWVTAGGVFIVHDRFVTDDSSDPQSNPFLIGRNDGDPDDILLDRDFTYGADIDVIDGSTLVTDGPGGVVDDTTLDGGNYSNHGFAVGATLTAAGDVSVLSAGPDPAAVAAFKYDLGSGSVYYSTIPLDFYIGGSNNFGSIYAPNAVAYANSRTQPDEDWFQVTVSGSSKAFQSATPADGPGEFVNNVDPHLELHDASGNLVSTGTALTDGRNERITVPVGTYLIRVTAEGGTFGEYALIDPPLAGGGGAGSATRSLARLPLPGALPLDPVVGTDWKDVIVDGGPSNIGRVALARYAEDARPEWPVVGTPRTEAVDRLMAQLATWPTHEQNAEPLQVDLALDGLDSDLWQALLGTRRGAD